jgi:L-serine deaminase
MNLTFLKFMSTPLAAAVRYGATSGMTALAAKYAIDGNTQAAIVNGIVAAVPAVIGMLTSTKSAAIAKVQAMPDHDVVPSRH